LPSGTTLIRRRSQKTSSSGCARWPDLREPPAPLRVRPPVLMVG
jgi:hypothetical protein